MVRSGGGGAEAMPRWSWAGGGLLVLLLLLLPRRWRVVAPLGYFCITRAPRDIALGLVVVVSSFTRGDRSLCGWLWLSCDPAPNPANELGRSGFR
jgi:hypothetical protein